MKADWPYYFLSASGHIETERGYKPFAADCRGGGPIQPRPFASVAEAEQWLHDMDIRGNIRSRGVP